MVNADEIRGSAPGDHPVTLGSQQQRREGLGMAVQRIHGVVLRIPHFRLTSVTTSTDSGVRTLFSRHGACVARVQLRPFGSRGSSRDGSRDDILMVEVFAMTLVNVKQRYVASTVCPIGKFGHVECAELAGRIFENDATASAALVAHLVSAECHTREQLARIVGGTRAYTHSYRLVYENRVEDGFAA